MRITPSANNAELVAQLDHAITDHEYPPKVWAAGEVVPEQVQISAAKLQAGSYAVWMGMNAPVTKLRAAVEAGIIGCCTMRVSLQSRSRNWSSTRHWGGNPAL